MVLLICVGVLAGALLFSSFRWLRVQMRKPSFRSAGFTFERCGPHRGWLSRDPSNGDWIMWNVKEHRMYRGATPDALLWMRSPESEGECIELGVASQAKEKDARRI